MAIKKKLQKKSDNGTIEKLEEARTLNCLTKNC